MKDSLYERAKSETRLAIYFAKEMIEELGNDKALELIGRAYQKYSNDVFSEPYLDIPLEKRFYKFKSDPIRSFLWPDIDRTERPGRARHGRSGLL